MYCRCRRTLTTILLVTFSLLVGMSAQGQDRVGNDSRQAITVLDSTKEQDGLIGSVRRVKTESAKIEVKQGLPVEGQAELIELTTYGIRGNRIENISYPTKGSLAGKEEYKYDDRGNITEMTVRDEKGAIISREAYTYEFDKFGNWTKMVTNLVVFENGELKREPVEVTYRTVTYYFDEAIAKIVDPASLYRPLEMPEPAILNTSRIEILNLDIGVPASQQSLTLAGDPPRLPTLERQPEKPAPAAVVSNTENHNNNSRALPIGTRVGSAEAPQQTVSEFEANSNSISGPLERSAVPAATRTEAPKSTDIAMQYYRAGRERFDLGDMGGAIDAYLMSIKMEPNSAEVYLNLGHAYLKSEKDRDAIKAFKESIKLNPKADEAQYGLGLACFRLGRFRDAADAFKKATSLNPKMAKAHYGLSLAYQELGDMNALMEEYRLLERLDRSLAKKLAQTFPQYNFSCRFTQVCQ